METLGLCIIALLVMGHVIVMEIEIMAEIKYRKTGKPLQFRWWKSKK